MAIVNRRGSDLTDKADGVLYTSDGRDVEMSVASTKAFYSQVAAGLLLAAAISDEVGGRVDQAVLRAARPARRHGRGDRPPAGHRRGRPQAGAREALLGRGRQRGQPHRRGRGADQAVGALLQVDRRRLHRGQEAHRPVLRAADHRVRRRARGVHRRRRGQGGRHLPAHKASPIVHRHRRPGPLRLGAPRPAGAADPPGAGVRALGHGRPPVRVRGGAGHRRPGAAAARGPGRDRGGDGGRRPRGRAWSAADGKRSCGGCGSTCNR